MTFRASPGEIWFSSQHRGDVSCALRRIIHWIIWFSSQQRPRNHYVAANYDIQGLNSTVSRGWTSRELRASPDYSLDNLVFVATTALCVTLCRLIMTFSFVYAELSGSIALEGWCCALRRIRCALRRIIVLRASPDFLSDANTCCCALRRILPPMLRTSPDSLRASPDCMFSISLIHIAKIQFCG